MQKLILLLIPFAFVLMSCEPIPLYPPGQRPIAQNAQRNDYRNDQRRSDYRDDQRRGDNAQDFSDQRRDQRRDVIPPTRVKPTYPLAERTNKPGQVLSPYAPYNVIDVQGFRSGQLAKDPSNGKIFRIP